MTRWTVAQQASPVLHCLPEFGPLSWWYYPNISSSATPFSSCPQSFPERKWKWKSLSSVWLFATPWTIQFLELSKTEYWNGYSPSLLQEIFPTQGSNPGLLHCRLILYQLNHKGSPRILEWVAYPLSRRSSRPRNQTGVSYTAGRFFTNWAIREAQSFSESGSFPMSLFFTSGGQSIGPWVGCHKQLIWQRLWNCTY